MFPDYDLQRLTFPFVSCHDFCGFLRSHGLKTFSKHFVCALSLVLT
jgi:hypothetical protein